MEVQIKFDPSQLQLVDPNYLVLDPKNRNTHTEEQIDRLCELFKYYGMRWPILVSKQSGVVKAGEGRLLAARKLKMPQVLVSYQDFDSEDMEIGFGISDNAIAAWASLDLSSINRFDVAQVGPDFNIDLFAIKNFKIVPEDKLPPGCDEDEVPDYAPPRTKRGDLYALGHHRLLCGDSTVVDDVGKLLGDAKADFIFTDPPYNIDYEGKTKDALKIQNDKMEDGAFYKFLYDAYTNMLLFTKPGGAIYVSHSDTEGTNFRKALTDAGWLLKQCLIWVKQKLVFGRKDYQYKHEPILYGWAPGASHNWYSDRKQTTVLEFNRPQRSSDHPTTKPLELVEYTMNNSCVPFGVVMDLFGGSGTTLIACEKTDRKCYMMELDPHYCDVIIARFEKYSNKKAELLNAQEA